MATITEIAKGIAEYLNAQKKTEEKAFESAVKARNIKYPWQTVAIKRKEKVLGVDARLTIPTENEKCGPLETSGFSRFVFTLLNKDGNNMLSATANIPVQDVHYMMEMTRISMYVMATSNSTGIPANAGSNEAHTGLAYTQKLFDKNFKGQTPASVLLKDPSQKEKLLSVKAWLEQNLTKYPANKSQISAIEEAVKLLEEGKLSASDNASVASTSNIPIYQSGFKFKTKKNDKGYNLIYEVNIGCDPTRKYPFSVSIMNCYAPVETVTGGQKNIKMTAAEDTHKFDIVMSKEEWFGLVSKMMDTKQYFEQEHFSEMHRTAEIAGQY